MITHEERLKYTADLFDNCCAFPLPHYDRYRDWLPFFNSMVRDFINCPITPTAIDIINHCIQLVAMVEKNPNVRFEVFSGCLDIMRTKGLSYANEQDCLANFKNAAKEAGTTPEQAMIIYIIKPIQSIRNVIIRNPDNPTVADGEAIRGRVMDIINYIVLMLLRAKERAAARDEKQEGNEHELATN